MLNLPMVEEESDRDWYDPLMLETFSVSFFNGIKESVQYLKANADKFIAPVLLVSGSDDVSLCERCH